MLGCQTTEGCIETYFQETVSKHALHQTWVRTYHSSTMYAKYRFKKKKCNFMNFYFANIFLRPLSSSPVTSRRSWFVDVVLVWPWPPIYALLCGICQTSREERLLRGSVFFGISPVVLPWTNAAVPPFAWHCNSLWFSHSIAFFVTSPWMPRGVGGLPIGWGCLWVCSDFYFAMREVNS
jgi:hypothetical protein